MKHVLTIAITSIIVSLDSFVAGFSVSLNKKQNSALPATVALVTFAMCAVTTFVGYALQGALDEYVNYLSAIILAALATVTLLKEETDGGALNIQTLDLSECVTVGVAVGLDASVANLSLALQGYGLIAPIIFALTHYFTVLAGQKLAGKLTMPNTNVFSAAVLFALAASKFI